MASTRSDWLPDAQIGIWLGSSPLDSHLVFLPRFSPWVAPLDSYPLNFTSSPGLGSPLGFPLLGFPLPDAQIGPQTFKFAPRHLDWPPDTQIGLQTFRFASRRSDLVPDVQIGLQTPRFASRRTDFPPDVQIGIQTLRFASRRSDWLPDAQIGLQTIRLGSRRSDCFVGASAL